MWTRLALAVAFYGALHSGVYAEPVKLTLPQVDALTQQALARQQPRLAYDLSGGLLQADPRNQRAHYYQALALAQVKAFGAARQSAARAFRTSETDVQRYQAAKMAAQLSFAGDQFTGSQFWLRRAVQYAPNDVSRAQTISEYRQVRNKNPVNFNFRFATTPSDNVNNGANSPLNIIDGVPEVGALSASGQALSGVVTTAELKGSYRLAINDTRQTRLNGRIYTRHVSLSDAVPGLSGSDLSSSTVEIGLSQFMTGTNEGVIWQFDTTGGRTWYGGNLLYDYASLGAQRRHKLSKKLTLSFGGDIEQQQDETGLGADSTHIDVFGSISIRLKNKSNLGFRLQFRDSDSDSILRTSKQWTGMVSYNLGKQVGPAQMSVLVGYSSLDYDEYSVGSISVPGGRQDDSAFGSVTATFKDWGYMGFVPTLAVTTEKSRSNIGRFDVDETSVTFGIRSEF